MNAASVASWNQELEDLVCLGYYAFDNQANGVREEILQMRHVLGIETSGKWY